MSKICDRSPCDSFLSALGDYIFCATDGFYQVVKLASGEESEVTIKYCMFCGTFLEEVPQAVIEKFTRPRRRRRRVATS